MNRATTKRAVKTAKRTKRKATRKRCQCGATESKLRRFAHGLCPACNAKVDALMAADGFMLGMDEDGIMTMAPAAKEDLDEEW